MANPIKWTIPGINQIKLIRCSEITPDIDKRYEAGAPCSVYTRSAEVQFFGHPECEVKEIHRRSGVKYAVTLKFKSNDLLARAWPVAFMVTDNNGKSTLIGLRESPYPIISVTDTAGEEKGSKTLEYTITSATMPVEVNDRTINEL